MPNDDVKTDGREALIAVVRALRDLDDETKRRVIEAACVFIGVKVNFQPGQRL